MARREYASEGSNDEHVNRYVIVTECGALVSEVAKDKRVEVAGQRDQASRWGASEHMAPFGAADHIWPCARLEGEGYIEITGVRAGTTPAGNSEETQRSW